jgi:hypothetical protein
VAPPVTVEPDALNARRSPRIAAAPEPSLLPPIQASPDLLLVTYRE